MILISACLAGVNCRYDGSNNLINKIQKLVSEGKAMLVCPEQLGGLTTPREPAEIIEDENGNVKVINKLGEDITDEFYKGAEETLKIAEMIGTRAAILKSRSPSCGYGEIYDGTFSGKKRKGNGLTAELLSERGIKIYTEEDNFNEILDKEE